MKRQVLLHFGFTDADYRAPHYAYPHETLCPAYGFGKYFTVWTFLDANGNLDVRRFMEDVRKLPQNCMLFINHENGKNYWPWQEGNCTLPNPAGIAEHRYLMNNVRLIRPDLSFGDYNASMRTDILWDPSWAKILRQSNEVIRLIGNGCHFLLPSFYPRKYVDPRNPDSGIMDPLLEIRSFAECVRAARETWPTAQIVPAITVQFNGEVCRLVWPRMVREGINFRWTAEELENCRLPANRLWTLLQSLAAEGISKIMVWSAGMVPVNSVQENLNVLSAWQNE